MKLKIILMCLAVTLTACGGGSASSDSPSADASTLDNCDVDIDALVTGQDDTDFTHFWSCITTDSSATIRLFADGTGYSSNTGSFVWGEVACGEIDITNDEGVTSLTDIDGSWETKIFTADATFDGETQALACEFF